VRRDVAFDDHPQLLRSLEPASRSTLAWDKLHASADVRFEPVSLRHPRRRSGVRWHRRLPWIRTLRRSCRAPAARCSFRPVQANIAETMHRTLARERAASVRRRAIGARHAPASVTRQQRRADCPYPWRLSHKSPSDPVCRTVMGRPMFKAPTRCNQMGRDRRQGRESRYVSHRSGS
jgi:hypothetical protein